MAQALSPTAAIAIVIPYRKGSVLEAGKVRRSGVPKAVMKWAEPLDMCHWWDSSATLQSAPYQVNSLTRRKAAKATQKDALRVARSCVDLSSLETRQRRRSRVIGRHSRGPVPRAAWKILMPPRIR